MKVRPVMLGLVGAVIGWLEPGSEDAVNLVRSSSREGCGAPEIVGSPAQGYHSAGAHFYTWQPERATVVAWLEELRPYDHEGRVAPR